MYRTLLALAAASALAACDGGNPNASSQFTGVGTGAQPLVDEPEATETGDTTAPVATDKYGSDFNSELTMNDVDFDPATGELVLNNMPFDGPDNVYARDAAGSAALALGGTAFDAYRNAAGPSNYYAVFRLSDAGFAQVAAAGTDRYVTFGFGGAGAERIDGTGNGALPAANDQYIFNGEYAAVRTIIDPDNGTAVQYVSGTAQIDVDIEDFDDIGAVEGIIVNRRFFDANGVEFVDIRNVDFISLATAEINFDTWSINSSTASVIQAGDSNASGNWQGLFAGPNGEEVAGIVFVEGTGPIGLDPATGDFIEVSVRETGGFVAAR